uniref:Uncharacterized protein n=1 Tax=Romanomermis culicivorax TaxID=13658 RepID=A0A915KUC6_ROMCU
MIHNIRNDCLEIVNGGRINKNEISFNESFSRPIDWLCCNFSNISSAHLSTAEFWAKVNDDDDVFGGCEKVTDGESGGGITLTGRESIDEGSGMGISTSSSSYNVSWVV